MPTANGFNTGKDITLVIVTPTGTLTIAGLTGFHSSQMTSPLDSKLIDGRNIYDEIPTGWEGGFDLERLDSTLDDYFSLAEDGYYNGVISNGVPTITETITESNGRITQYSYQGVALKFADAGKWTGDAKVMQSVTFRCSRRPKVQ